MHENGSKILLFCRKPVPACTHNSQRKMNGNVMKPMAMLQIVLVKMPCDMA
jgi:hypothetical protein